MKRIILICALFIAGCTFPPDEATQIQQQLQARISKGQVYLNYSADEVSFVIRNSEYTKRTESEKEKLVRGVEKQALELLSKHEGFKRVNVYFMGEGTAGIKSPFVCDTTGNGCRKKQSATE